MVLFLYKQLMTHLKMTNRSKSSFIIEINNIIDFFKDPIFYITAQYHIEAKCAQIWIEWILESTYFYALIILTPCIILITDISSNSV